MRPEGRTPAVPVLKGLNTAFKAMNYDIGLLAEGEAEALQEAGIEPGPWRRTANQEPSTEVKTLDGRTVVFLRFPTLPRGESRASDDVVDALSKLIESKRAVSDLIVGLCDWGWVAENDYQQREGAILPDVLLGSGGGSGVNGRLLNDRCLWVRCYDKGRSLAEISILEWPNRQNLFAWKDAKNYKTTSIGMNDAIKDDPSISALFD